MLVLTVETSPQLSSPPPPKKLKGAATEACKWLTERLGYRRHSRLTRTQFSAICVAILVSTVGVRLLHLQDSSVEVVAGKNSLSGVFNRYQKEARRILDEGGILFPRERPASGDARMLVHPPGYSILLATILHLSNDPYRALWLVQIVCEGAAALLVFLIALELLNWGVALIAGLLVAFSPHLAHYSLLLTPDSLVVLPLLAAVYCILRGWTREPRMRNMILAGSLIGVSCWLTSTPMLLAPFLSIVVFFIFDRSKRLLFSFVIVASSMVVIAPITIRNAIVFHRFIPLSIQAGLSLVEGLGDYDKDGRLGMPRSDREARQQDAEWNGRPDYATSLWYPDGIDRDYARLRRGLAVVRSNPGWFTRIALHRAAFMVSYNESRAREWPVNTATASPVYAEQKYGHPLELIDESQSLSAHPTVLVLNGAIIPGVLAVKDDRQPISSSPPGELNATGSVLSPQTVALLEGGGQTLQLTGDNSEYGDEFASAPIAVRKNTDYLLVLPVHLMNADMALKVTNSDRRVTLAFAALDEAEKEAISVVGRNAVADPSAMRSRAEIQLPFASGDRTEVRLVMSNNGATPTPPSVQLGQAEFFEIGPTPCVWTRYARLAVKAIQHNFTTVLMRTLILLGIVALVLAPGARALLILLALPLYYVTLQAPLHTEYRYILSIHYFLFIFVAVTIYCFAAAASQASRLSVKRLATHIRPQSFSERDSFMGS